MAEKKTKKTDEAAVEETAVEATETMIVFHIQRG